MNKVEIRFAKLHPYWDASLTGCKEEEVWL